MMTETAGMEPPPYGGAGNCVAQQCIIIQKQLRQNGT